MSVLTPHCLICCRRFSRLGLLSWAPGQIQIRGKKKNAKKPTHISVKLLSDMAAYGRKGRIVPITAGRMRIDFFPRGIAEYLTRAELKELKRSETPVARDRSYGKVEVIDNLAGAGLLGMGKKSSKLSSEPVRRADLDMLKPEVAFERLAQFLPPHFDFYRVPISDTFDPPGSPGSPGMSDERTASPNVADAQSHALQSNSLQSSTSIYGSVGTMDIAIAIKALLAESDLAGTVVIEANQIRFVRKQTEGGDVDRVKMLGEYEIEVKVKGHGEAMRRKVRVLAESQDRNDP